MGVKGRGGVSEKTARDCARGCGMALCSSSRAHHDVLHDDGATATVSGPVQHQKSGCVRRERRSRGATARSATQSLANARGGRADDCEQRSGAGAHQTTKSRVAPRRWHQGTAERRLGASTRAAKTQARPSTRWGVCAPGLRPVVCQRGGRVSQGLGGSAIAFNCLIATPFQDSIFSPSPPPRPQQLPGAMLARLARAVGPGRVAEVHALLEVAATTAGRAQAAQVRV